MRTLYAFVPLLAGALVSCTPSSSDPPPGSADAFLIVAGTPVPAGVLRRAIAARPRVVSPESRQAVVEQLVRTEVLVHRARERGFHRDPELVDAWKRLLATRFAERELAERRDAQRVTEREVARYYREHIADYTSVTAARAAILLLRVPDGAPEDVVSEASLRAERLRAEVAASPEPRETFAALAQAHSEDRASRYIGGDTGWVTSQTEAYRWGAAVRDAVFEIAAPGEVARVVRAEAGFFVVQLIERRPSQQRPLEAVRDDVRRRLLERKRTRVKAEFDAEMRRGVDVHVRDAVVEQVFREVPAAMEVRATRNESYAVKQETRV